MAILFQILTILNTVLLVVILVHLRSRRSAGQSTGSSATQFPLPGGVALAQKIAQVNPGATRSSVEALLGPPGATNQQNWIYYLDRYSGYIIEFTNDRVDRIQDWKS